MIDWITMVAPLPHTQLINGGAFISIDADGAIEYETTKRHKIEGSYSTGLQVRTAVYVTGDFDFIEISGNPVKFFQGHNLWGTADLPGLALATLEHVASVLNIEVSVETRLLWVGGHIQLTRVDATESFHLTNMGEVLAFLRAAEQTAHLSHRGRGQLVKGSTLYFGKNSRRWSLKLYSKGQEIRAKGHGQDSILELPHAVAWAERTLRVEVTLRSMELKRLQLNYVRDWISRKGVISLPSRLVMQYLGEMTMTTTGHLPFDVLGTLRPALRTAVQAWEAGNDLRNTLSRPTFYRYRRELLKHGIDIATLLPREEISNVVPLHRVLEAKPASIPDWAIDTPLYFDPINRAR